MDTWWNGCFGKMDDHPVHTTPNQNPLKMDVLLKTFLQIVLAAKWLMWHSSMSFNQQWRPLPSLLSDSTDCTNLSAYKNKKLIFEFLPWINLFLTGLFFRKTMEPYELYFELYGIPKVKHSLACRDWTQRSLVPSPCRLTIYLLISIFDNDLVYLQYP